MIFFETLGSFQKWELLFDYFPYFDSIKMKLDYNFLEFDSNLLKSNYNLLELDYNLLELESNFCDLKSLNLGFIY